jgi:hypothetical protein
MPSKTISWLEFFIPRCGSLDGIGNLSKKPYEKFLLSFY